MLTTFSGYPPWWIQRMRSILPCCLPCGKAGELQILCCQGFEVNDYNFTLDASRGAGSHVWFYTFKCADWLWSPPAFAMLGFSESCDFRVWWPVNESKLRIPQSVKPFSSNDPKNVSVHRFSLPWPPARSLRFQPTPRRVRLIESYYGPSQAPKYESK